MSLSALIRKRGTVQVATAIPAISATPPSDKPRIVARIATVAVANAPKPANTSLADDRIAKMVAKLEGDCDLRYAMETHLDADPESVILTVAIRDKGACEVRIPRSRYDAFRLLQVIEKHTRRETLQ